MSPFSRLTALSLTPIAVLKAACHKVSVPLKSKRATRPNSLFLPFSRLNYFNAGKKNVQAKMFKFDFRAAFFFSSSLQWDPGEGCVTLR